MDDELLVDKMQLLQVYVLNVLSYSSNISPFIAQLN